MISVPLRADAGALRGRRLDTAVKAVRAAAAIQLHHRAAFDPAGDDAARTRQGEAAELEARAAALFQIGLAEAAPATVAYSETAVVTLDAAGRVVHCEPNGHDADGSWRRPVHEAYWVVDALDGIAGFRRGLPFSCATIAYIEDGKTELGAIYAPVTNELFCAMRGAVPLLNGRPIRTSGRTAMAGAMVCSGNDLRFRPARPAGLQLRNFGSHAFSLAYVACGRTEGYVSVPALPHHLGPSDCAAGALLVGAAGGECLGPAGAAFDPWSGGTVAASTPALAGNLAEAVAWPEMPAVRSVR
jgi:fructose-1,6-bisphosphatase/inositol monophosphatase family enzyme